MPATTRKTPAKAKAADETPVEDQAAAVTYDAPTTVADLGTVVAELLDYVVLRDSDDRTWLHAKLVGGEVPGDAHEASEAEGNGEG